MIPDSRTTAIKVLVMTDFEQQSPARPLRRTAQATRLIDQFCAHWLNFIESSMAVLNGGYSYDSCMLRDQCQIHPGGRVGAANVAAPF